MRKSGAERVEDILNAVIDILAEEGVHRLTVRNIGGRIGISDAAIYRHFTSKEDMMNVLTERLFRKPVRRPQGDAVLELEAIMTARVESFEQRPALAAVMFNENLLREFPGVREAFDRHRRATHALIATVVRDGQRRLRITTDLDPEAFATLFMGGLRMMVLEWRAGGCAHPLSEGQAPVMGLLCRLLEA